MKTKDNIELPGDNGLVINLDFDSLVSKVNEIDKPKRLSSYIKTPATTTCTVEDTPYLLQDTFEVGLRESFSAGTSATFVLDDSVLDDAYLVTIVFTASVSDSSIVSLKLYKNGTFGTAGVYVSGTLIDTIAIGTLSDGDTEFYVSIPMSTIVELSGGDSISVTVESDTALVEITPINARVNVTKVL